MPQQFKNLVDMFSRSVEKFADNRRFGTKRNGAWEWMTFAEMGEQVDAFRSGLASIGIERGDAVAVISNNRVEWAVGAYATYGRGALYVPMYEKQNPEDWEYIIADSGAKAILVADDKVAAKIKGIRERLPGVATVINLTGNDHADMTYQQVLDAGQGAPVQPADPNPGDLAGLIYTSGTTGRPKGVKLTHNNFTSNVNAVQGLFPMRDNDLSLSFLPWAHSFGQTCELHTLLSFGGASAINSEVPLLVQEIGEIKPTVFFSVPRVYNKIYDGIHKKMAASTVSKMVFDAAMKTAEQKTALERQGRSSGWVNFKHRMFDQVVFSKIRDRLGGRLQHAFSGGAALSKDVAIFMDNIGVTVFEGYGLSETSPIATMNYPDHRKVGSVGKALPGVEILIDTDAVGNELGDQGEVVIKGPNVMQGYHNLDAKTAEVIGADGAFRSGDIGRLDEEGYLFITGRIKEQYKLENGKYVVPAPLEDHLALSGFISQTMVYGDNKLFNVAVIFPDFAAVREWGEASGVSGTDEELCKNEKVLAKIREEIDAQQKTVFKGYERIKDFRLITEEMTVDNNMLTPKLSMKRRNVIKAYQHLLDEMFAK
ncbi:MAG: long-chain fatty acid--CoA ligase [Myxococcota bacterium]